MFYGVRTRTISMSNIDIGLIETAAEAAVQRALSYTVVPVIRHGVLIEPDTFGMRIHSVQIDGDTTSIACHDITTGYTIPVGARVTVLFAPPHQAMIIGVVTPLGPIAQLIDDGDSGTHSVSAVTDMTLSDVPLVAGRTYGINLHSVVEWASLDVLARWAVILRVNTVQIDRLGDVHDAITGVSHYVIDSTVEYTPDVTGQYDLDVFVSELVNGSTITFKGTATSLRKFTVYDHGVLPDT